MSAPNPELLAAYPRCTPKYRATFTSLKAQANQPLAELLAEGIGLADDDWLTWHHADLQQYADIDIEAKVLASLEDAEAIRLNSYPQFTRDEWDLIQAEELFDNDGEPLTEPHAWSAAFDSLKADSVIREDVIALLMECDTGLITEEQMLGYLDQIECTAEELEEAGAEMDRRAQDAHDSADRLK